MNLIEKLSAQDLTNIQNYRKLFQINGGSFGEGTLTSVEDFLSDWNKSKVKLYKALGNCFRKNIKFSYEVPEVEKKSEISDIIDNFIYLKEVMLDKVMPTYKKLVNKLDVSEDNKEDIIYDMEKRIITCFWTSIIYENACDRVLIYYKLNNKGELKRYQSAAGTKPFRFLTTVVNDFVEKKYQDMLLKDIDKYRTAVSMVNNKDRKECDLILSIHPLDFMSMSDNAPNSWTSCMNWQAEGCYRLGSAEMMTSNNTIIAFMANKVLDARDLYNYCREDGEYYAYSPRDCYKYIKEPVPYFDKSWRCLFYVEKDILLSGKSYPFTREEITKGVLKVVHDTIKENLNWDYEFGIEPYKDMTHMYDQSFEHIRAAKSNKKYIVFDTKKMYNDMYNAQDYPYFCYRNKPKHAKIICVSGKIRCSCCDKVLNDEPIIEKDTHLAYDYYNDRYGQTQCFICDDCRANLCSRCRNAASSAKDNIVLKDGTRICPECLKHCIFYSKEAYDKIVAEYPVFKNSDRWMFREKDAYDLLTQSDLIFGEGVSDKDIIKTRDEFMLTMLKGRGYREFNDEVSLEELIEEMYKFVKDNDLVEDVVFRSANYIGGRDCSHEDEFYEKVMSHWNMCGFRRIKEKRPFEPWSLKNWVVGEIQEYV